MSGGQQLVGRNILLINCENFVGIYSHHVVAPFEFYLLIFAFFYSATLWIFVILSLSVAQDNQFLMSRQQFAWDLFKVCCHFIIILSSLINSFHFFQEHSNDIKFPHFTVIVGLCDEPFVPWNNQNDIYNC